MPFPPQLVPAANTVDSRSDVVRYPDDEGVGDVGIEAVADELPNPVSSFQMITGQLGKQGSEPLGPFAIRWSEGAIDVGRGDPWLPTGIKADPFTHQDVVAPRIVLGLSDVVVVRPDDSKFGRARPV
jgi:hypothetical protein